MPELVLYIWLICELCIWYSLGAFCHSPPNISNSTSHIFNSTSEFSFTLQWSLVETIISLWRGGRWRSVDLLPRLFRLFRRFCPSCSANKYLPSRDSVKRRCGQRMVLLLKKNTMLILLNLLVNCHLLRNASFGFFFLSFEFIYILLSAKQRKCYGMFLLVFQPYQSEFTVELRTLVRHTIRQNNTFTF